MLLGSDAWRLMTIPDPLSYLSLTMLGFNKYLWHSGTKQIYALKQSKCFLWLHLHYRNPIAQLT